MDDQALARQVAEQFDKRLSAVEQKLSAADQMALANSEHIISLQKAVSDIAADTKLNSSEIKHLNLAMGKLDSTIQASTTKVESTVSEIWRALTSIKDGIAPAIKEAVVPLQTSLGNLNDYKQQQIGSLKVWVIVAMGGGTVLSTLVGVCVNKLLQ